MRTLRVDFELLICRVLKPDFSSYITNFDDLVHRYSIFINFRVIFALKSPLDSVIYLMFKNPLFQISTLRSSNCRGSRTSSHQSFELKIKGQKPHILRIVPSRFQPIWFTRSLKTTDKNLNSISILKFQILPSTKFSKWYAVPPPSQFSMGATVETPRAIVLYGNSQRGVVGVWVS